MIKALSPFGGGLGSSGGTCGSLAGALAILGILMGKKGPEERDHRLMWKLSNKMVKVFREITREYGGMNCSDIARIDWKDIKQVKSFYRDPSSRRRECFKVIAKTVQELEKLVDDYAAKEEA